MKTLCRALAGAVVLMLLSASVVSAGATQAGEQPLAIKSSSLVQDGQTVVWRLVMSQPFAPTALARNHRKLCLLLDRNSNASGFGQICLGGHRDTRLSYMPVTAAGPGRARSVPATVTRGNSSELTAAFVPTDIGLAYKPLRWQVLSQASSPACPAGSSCVTLFPDRAARLALHTPELVGCLARGPEFVSNGPTKVRDVALTFDDGPWSEPPSIDFVNLLAREHVPATFFEIGRQIGPYDPHGAIERRMLADGDMIGDHTWSHPVMTQLAAGAQRSELTMAADAIRRATRGFQPCLFRAPYGAVNSSLLSVAHSLHMATIQWNVDPRDWALPGVSAILGNVVANSRSGSIVIEHFGGGPRYETLSALPGEIAALRRRGYTFVTVTQMLGYKLIYK